ncbi:hypothetical protein KQI86_09700 [Clostridium sp. MSJ-11]|uniref:DUF3592 domain-containing protein n=1 Tax=Clostridium mobile TaxID=2841512 RepID=A0ABS6EHB3_9CLOT|nr:hypothetical protein [Clostridium mobile]MBU5484604.1 hypothetical protein [Clostridium mobile]
MSRNIESILAILLFSMASATSIVYSAYQFISFMLNKNRINYTMSTIIDTKTAFPESMKKNNSTWAMVRFRVNEKEYVSSSWIQVSMNVLVGDEIRIAYFKDNPSEIFTPNLNKAAIFFLIGIA